LPKGTQVDFPIEDIHDFKQAAFMVDEQVVVVFQTTKFKVKCGTPKKKHQRLFSSLRKSLFFLLHFHHWPLPKGVLHHLLSMLTNKCKSTWVNAWYGGSFWASCTCILQGTLGLNTYDKKYICLDLLID
jgi:hypothetical protein